MPGGRPRRDAAESRAWLEQAKGLADNADAAAAIAQTYAMLLLADRLGAVIERLMPAAGSRVPRSEQDAADEAAIDRVVAQGSVHVDAVIRFVQEDLSIAMTEAENVMLRRLVAAARADHPVQAADRAWYEAEKRNAVAARDAQAIRSAVDGVNRTRTEERYDTSQYAGAMDETERRWANADELAEVQAVEAQIDPDVAATNAARRREERQERQMDRSVARGTGIFGQMGPSEEEDA